MRMSFSEDSINKLDAQSSPKLLLNLFFTIFKRLIVLSAEQLVSGNGTAWSRDVPSVFDRDIFSNELGRSHAQSGRPLSDNIHLTLNWSTHVHYILINTTFLIPNPLTFSPEFGPASLSGFQQGCGPQVSVCQKSKYRSLDGTCNNPYKPTWGAANTPYARVKPAKYADGVQDPPVSHSGKPLPGARLVSAVLFPDADIPDPKWTLIAMQWGQIITHDLSQAAGTTQASFVETCHLAIPQI
uniref:Peroxidase n=1 Tax=Timema douglasi TaxID=61478 RepID=A0A7R8VS35_TIMDO|nr:unnamed protein product [Timema douglasi]